MPSPIPVLHLRSSAETSGPDRVLLDLIPKLDDLGYPCELALLSDRRRPADHLVAAALERGVETVEIPTRGPIDPGLLVRLARMARDFALIHAHEPKSHVYGWAIARRTGRPWIATHHGWLGRDPREQLYERLDLQALRRADRVLCVARSGAAELVGRWGVPPAAVRVVHNGIDTARIGQVSRQQLCERLGLRDDLPVVVAVGRLERGKGFATLLEAQHQLHVSGRDVQVVVMGEGSERGTLRARSADLGLAERFLLPGYIADAPAFLHGADVFVLASLHEQHPISLLEAMAQATPVVATRVGGIPDTVEHGVHGMLVEPQEPTAMAAAIERLLGDRARARALGAAGHKRILDEFSAEQMARGYANVYAELLS